MNIKYFVEKDGKYFADFNSDSSWDDLGKALKIDDALTIAMQFEAKVVSFIRDDLIPKNDPVTKYAIINDQGLYFAYRTSHNPMAFDPDWRPIWNKDICWSTTDKDIAIKGLDQLIINESSARIVEIYVNE